MSDLIKYIVSSVIVAEAYNKLTVPVEKYQWQSQINMHHGAFGVLIGVIGLLTESPKLVGIGIGLALHDWDDRYKWFPSSS